MHTGNLYLDYTNDDEEAHYEAEITRCVIRENELSFEFKGIDEGHPYSGACVLTRNGECFSGECSFVYADRDNVPAHVDVAVEKYEGEVSLQGTWRDQGEGEPYQLEAELTEV